MALTHDEMKSLMEAARTARDKLNTATDLLNTSIKEMERELRMLNLGVYAEVEIERVSPELYAVLAFGKVKDEWVLQYIRRAPPGDKCDRLLHAPRHVRMASVRFMPALVAALAEAVKVELGRVHSAIEQVREFDKALEAYTGRAK